MAYYICSNPKCKKEFYSKHSTAKYCSRSCSVAINKKNLEKTNRDVKWTDHELLKILVEVSTKIGKTVSRSEFDALVDSPSAWTYTYRFGSWNKAIMQARLIPNLPNPEIAKKVLLLNDVKSIQPSLRFEIFKRDDFRCQYCGGTPIQGYVLNVDHITPVSKGGSSNKNNLITSCWVCNVGKSNSSL